MTAESVIPAPAQNTVNNQSVSNSPQQPSTSSPASSPSQADSISAVKAANEALANMVGLVKDLVETKEKTKKEGNRLKTAMMASFGFSESDIINAATSCSKTFIREVRKTGTMFAEDMLSLNNVSPTIRKQILEGKYVNCNAFVPS